MRSDPSNTAANAPGNGPAPSAGPADAILQPMVRSMETGLGDALHGMFGTDAFAAGLGATMRLQLLHQRFWQEVLRRQMEWLALPGRDDVEALSDQIRDLRRRVEDLARPRAAEGGSRPEGYARAASRDGTGREPAGEAP